MMSGLLRDGLCRLRRVKFSFFDKMDSPDLFFDGSYYK